MDKQKECVHDWEIVEKGLVKRVIIKLFTQEVVSDFYTEEDHIGYYTLGNTVLTGEDKICLICGKRDFGIERFKKAYLDQERKKRHAIRDKRRRREIGKQLWKDSDGCDG